MEVIIDSKNKRVIGDLVDLIKEELNVKEVVFEDNLATYSKFIVKPNFKEVGKILGPKIKEFQEVLSKLSIDEVNKLRNDEKIVVLLSGEEFTIESGMVDIRVESKEGFDATYKDSSLIKSLKVKTDGNFYNYSKVLTNDEIEKLIELVEDKIIECIEKIHKGIFDINPKNIDSKNIGCQYCEYKDICFMTNDDIVYLGGD